MKVSFKKLLHVPAGIYFAIAFVTTTSLAIISTELWSFYFQIALWCFVAAIYCPYGNWMVKTFFSLVGSVQVFNGLMWFCPSDVPGLKMILESLLFLWVCFLLVLKYDTPNDRLDNSYFYVLRKKEDCFLDFCKSLFHPFLNTVIFADDNFYHFNNRVLQKTERKAFTNSVGYKHYKIKRGPALNVNVITALDDSVGEKWSWMNFVRRNRHAART